ncbi:MAG: FAD:protein FMN transferase [Alkalispirochaeta sp.]
MHRIPRGPKRFGTLFLLFSGLVAMTVTGCSSSDEPVNDSAQLLGTILQISIRDGGYSTTLTDRAFERVAEIERRMSTSEDDYESTELLRVNRASGDEPVSVSEDTFEVLQAAREFSRMSDGAFDVTIWPLVKLWAIGSGGTSVPPEEEIDTARRAVDYRLLELDEEEQTVYLPEEGMGVDVGAIAKGYAADEAARILREAGVEHALLDFGGNIVVIGTKPDGTLWRIGVQRPDAERTRYLGIVSTSDKTVVTSGPYERFFVQEGVRYHHILNADTGFPARSGIEQVTIIADRSIDADALSTATYVLGVEDGLSLVESQDGVEAVFITEDRLVHMTSGARQYFELTDDEFTLAGG